MKVLVTGGSGFIGSHLVDALVEDGHQVTVLDLWISMPGAVHVGKPGFRFEYGNILDTPLMDRLCSEADVVFDLAGILGTSETLNGISLQDVIQTNLIGLSHILEATTKAGALLIYLTSPDVPWLNPYRITKQAAEGLCRMYHREFGARIVVLRLGNVYGPRERWQGANLGAPYNYRKVVPTFIRRALSGGPLEIYGDGSQKAPYIYVGDVVRAMMMAMDNGDAVGKLIPIVRNPSLSVNELATEVLKATDSQSEIVYVPMRAGEQHIDVQLDTETAWNLLGFEAETDIGVGLAKTVPYYAAS